MGKSKQGLSGHKPVKAASTSKNSLIRIAASAVLVLLVPLVAMQFSDGVNWGPADFLIAFGLLFGAGLAYTLAIKKAQGTGRKAFIGAAVLVVLMVIWAQLAVGIFS